MRRIAIAVQQDDDGDLDPERDQFARRLQRTGGVERVDLAAIGGEAAAHFAHQSPRHQRQRPARIEAHRVRDRQALQFEQVAEA